MSEGLNPIGIVTELRRRHAGGEMATGINVRKNCITDMYVYSHRMTRTHEEKGTQPPVQGPHTSPSVFA